MSEEKNKDLTPDTGAEDKAAAEAAKKAYKESIKEQRRKEKEEIKRNKKQAKEFIIELDNGEKIKVNPRKKHNKKSILDILFLIVDYLFFIVFTLSCLFPFYYLFINTISDASLVSRGMINFIPKGINIQNYLALRNVSDLGNSLIVSLGRTILGTALMVLASAFVGYLVTKQEMWHRKFFYRFLVITMYFNAGLIPWYLNMSMLGLTNSFAAYIIPGIVAPYNIILVKTYIESIPAELEESAFIDGASYMTVFAKIVWPLSKPILATIAIFGAVGNWNSFQDSLILMTNSPNLYTLQHRLYIYLNTSSNLGAVMNSAGSGSSAALDYASNGKIIKYTISMVSIIPILLVYPFMQRYFEEGIMLGAVKG
jgi:multiple sugar transport system permease protein/putative aldouronate transport system permease protein